MSTYVREKVLRIPRHKMNFAHIVRKLEEKYPDNDVMDDLGCYLENVLPHLRTQKSAPGWFRPAGIREWIPIPTTGHKGPSFCC